MTERAAVEIVSIMTAAWPSAAWPIATQKLYAKMLLCYPAEAGRRAVLDLVRLSKFRPAFAEISERIARVLLEAQGVAVVSAAEAWRLVEHEIAAVGIYRDPDLGNPLVMSAVRQVGWRALCLSDRRDLLRSQFFKIYESSLEANLRQKQLTGEEQGERVAKAVLPTLHGREGE